jgi:O-antigen/teichoic acid export membrane protein
MISRFSNGRTATRLRQLATGGAAAIAVSVGLTSVLRIISSMTLTRVLDSHAYGVVGIITTVAFMLGMLSDVGLASFIIRHQEGNDRLFRDQVWTIRLVRGAILAAIMALISKPAAIALGKPELAPVVAVWSISFLVDGMSSLAFATAIREQKLWRMSLLDLSLNVSTFIVSVALAFIWRSYWALIAGMLAGAICKCLLSYILFPNSRQRFVFNRERSRELWGFSRYIAMSSMLSLLILQSDKIVLARLMPLATYGLYAIATTLAAAPASLSVPYANRVLYAAYSKAVRIDPATLRHVFYERRRKVVLLYMFAVSMIIGGAPLLIEILYDPRYRGVAPYLQLITITAVLRMPSLAADQALIALGRTRSTLFSNVFRIIWLAIGGAVGIATGNIMLLVAIVGTVEIPGIISSWFNLWRADLLNVKEEAYGLAAAAAGILVGIGVSQAGLTLLGAA